MEVIVGRLNVGGLKRFFAKHKFKLCNTLTSLEDIGLALGMTDVDISEYIGQKTVTMQASKLLHFIGMRNSAEEFIQALQDTANDRALDYIGKALENDAALGFQESRQAGGSAVKQGANGGEGDAGKTILSDSERVEALIDYLAGSKESLSEFLNPLLPDICTKLVGVPQFIVYLQSKKILTPYDVQEIKAEKTNFAKIDAIFSYFTAKELHDQIFEHLLEALLKTGNQDVIRTMYKKIEMNPPT